MYEILWKSDHMTLVDSRTTYTTDDPFKTFFERVYSVISSFDSLSPVGCLGVRLEDVSDLPLYL